MKKMVLLLLLVLLAAASAGCVTYSGPVVAYAVAPPNVVIGEPDFLYLVPYSGIYFVPGISAEIFFYSGRWYHRSGAVWYWSSGYSGPWASIQIRVLPAPLRKIKRDYRFTYARPFYKVPYGHWKNRRTAPPPIKKYGPPAYVYKQPGGVYRYPGIKDDIFYHDGAWYNRHKGVYYSGPNYKGPWKYVDTGKVPKSFRKMSPEFKSPTKRDSYKRVPWQEMEPKIRKRSQKRKGKGKYDD